jgi:hypothetical protein
MKENRPMTSKADREAIEDQRHDDVRFLRSILMKGSRVYVEYVKSNRNGDFHHLRFFTPGDNRILNITGAVARIIGKPFTKQGTMTIRGGGMDMGFEAVYRLSGALFGYESDHAHDLIKESL